MARRPAHTTAMIRVVGAVVPALKTVEVGQHHAPLGSQLFTGIRTAPNLLLGLQMRE